MPTLDPHLRDNVWTRLVTDNLYEALLTREDDGTLIPLLAEALPEQVDDTTWSVTIRSGVEFSNGEPFDAEAAAASINRMADPALESELLGLIETVKGAEAVDESTVEITTKGLDVLLPARLTLIKMVPPEHSQEDDFAETPAGTAPYVHVSGTGTGPIVLEKNPDYWGGEDVADIDKVTVETIADVTTRVSALQAGEIDLITVLPPDSVEDVPKALSVVGIENPMVVLNSTDGVTSDPLVRQALNMAVDRDALADELFGGFAEPSRCQPVAPLALGYNESLEPYPYDPEEARSLIQEAGVEGESITLITSDVFTKGREMGEVIASYWREVGLDVKMELPDFDTYLEHLYAKGPDHPAGVYVSSSTDLLEAAAASRQLTTEGIQSAYSNPEVDGLYEEALQTVDSAERAEVYSEALGIACEEAALVSLLHVEDIYGTSERLQWEPRSDGAVYGPLFHDMSVTE